MGNVNGHGDMELVPQGTAPEQPDLEQYLIQDEAAAWRLNLRDASYTHQKIWSEQERFLAAFRTGGTIKAGLENVTVCRRTVKLWKQHDTLRFKERFLAAHEEFCDSQEQILYTLNGGLKPGQNPVGLLGTLNANRPEKWHPALKLTHEVPNELIAQLKRLQALEPAPPAPKKLGPVTVEAEAEVMPWEDQPFSDGQKHS